jgi:TrmH family RNA methyltransferase
LILCVDRLEKPGNLGAVLRTAAAVGATAVVSLSGGIDRFNPNVLRASTGAVFDTPTIVVEFEEFREWATANDVTVVAADPATERSYWDVDLTRSVAIVAGAESDGLSADVLRRSDVRVSVPMTAAAVDSLNVSVTVALIAYEAVRQRSYPLS